MRNETSSGSSHRHQWPHAPLPQMAPVMRTPIANMSDWWIVTYDFRSYFGLRVRRYCSPKIPPAMNPPSATIAIGTWM